MEEKSLQNESKTEGEGEERAILIYFDAMIKEKKNLLIWGVSVYIFPVK